MIIYLGVTKLLLNKSEFEEFQASEFYKIYADSSPPPQENVTPFKKEITTKNEPDSVSGVKTSTSSDNTQYLKKILESNKRIESKLNKFEDKLCDIEERLQALEMRSKNKQVNENPSIRELCGDDTFNVNDQTINLIADLLS